MMGKQTKKRSLKPRALMIKYTLLEGPQSLTQERGI
jgi:hypothetical protein